MLFWLLAQADHATDDAADAASHSADASDLAAVMDMNLLPAATALAVFLLAFGILYVKVWPMITKGLDEREGKIRETLAAADAAKESAEAALAENEKAKAQIVTERGEAIAKAKADAKAVGEELKRQNEADLTEMKNRATRDIEAAKTTAITQLHTEATMLASMIASKILQREITADDQQNLVEEALGELGKMRKS